MSARRYGRWLASAALLLSAMHAHAMGSAPPWQEEFGIEKCNLQTTGRNEYFILEPGYQLVLEGGDERLEITVLNETKMVAGVNTRVVEEREWKKGKLSEVSRNYFAFCEQTRDVFYFGEDVDIYENDKVVKHEGAWLAGANGNRAGLIMPGAPKVGMRYYQEIAPGVAMDRAEIVSVTETCKTPAGTFSRCMKVKETSALEFFASEYKYHAPGIGLVRDEDLVLVKHGFIRQ
jgi:uncharacterized Fe-S cluster protein YjdI